MRRYGGREASAGAGMGVARGLERAIPMVGSCAREAWRVGAGVGVGDEDEEGGRESWRRREERAGRRGPGVMEGFCAGAGERGGREEAVAVLGEGEVDIVGDCCLVVGRGIATARVGWL